MKLTQIVCTGLIPLWLATAQPTVDPAQVCSAPPNFRADLELDGNTNTILGGRTEYPRLQEVKVLVHRPNPFKYNYRATYTAKVLESEAVAQFLGFLRLTPEALAEPAAPPPPAPPPPLTVAAVDPPECRSAADRFRTEAIQPVQVKLAAVRQAVAARKTSIERINQFISSVSNDSITNCNQAVVEAVVVRGLLDSLAELNQLENLMSEAEAALTDAGLTDRLAEWQTANGQCRRAGKALAEEIGKLEKDVPAARKSVDQLKSDLTSEESVKTRQALAGRIEAVLTADHPFYQWFSLPRPVEPMQYEISGAKQEMFPKPGSMTAAAQVVKVTIGRPRFTLSAGIGLTSIGERNIVRQAGPPTGAQVFGYDKNSPLRPALVVLGTGHIHNFRDRDLTFGLSTGFLLGSQQGSANYEFVLGPSFGFLRNLMIVTPGVHIGKRQQIARFGIGDSIPAGLADPLPVENNWRAGAIIAITFRMR